MEWFGTSAVFIMKKMLLSCFKLKTMLNEMKVINYSVVLIDTVNSATLQKPFNILC